MVPSLSPTRDEFHALAGRGNLVPVFAELPGDLDTPLSAYLRLRPGPYSFLLESVEGGEKWARYSFLGTDPLMVLTAKDGRIILRRSGNRVVERLPDGNPLDALRGLLRQFQPVSVPGLPRFQGGAVGYLAYDMVRHMERLPATTRDDLGLADAVFMFTDTLLVFDNLRHRLLVMANAHIQAQDDRSIDVAYDQAALRIGMTLAKLQRPSRRPRRSTSRPPGRSSPSARRASPRRWTRRLSPTECAGPRSTSRPEMPIRSSWPGAWTASCPPIPSRSTGRFAPSIPRRTSSSSVWAAPPSWGLLPRCWCAWKATGWRCVPSPAPARGERPRAQDQAIEQALLNDPKERAEHVMLVDLGRNDVGRVSSLGSVKVTEFMGIERYSHVMHLVSHVVGQLAPGADALNVLQACFPAGTLTGAPKIRAMEIIDELEPTRRGPYGGAVGYISYSGNLDSCITIRTIVCHDNRASIQVGAGIVADSDPKTEWLETCSKARGLVLALRMAAAT